MGDAFVAAASSSFVLGLSLSFKAVSNSFRSTAIGAATVRFGSAQMFHKSDSTGVSTGDVCNSIQIIVLEVFRLIERVPKMIWWIALREEHS